MSQSSNSYSAIRSIAFSILVSASLLPAQSLSMSSPKASAEYFSNLRESYVKQQSGIIGWVSDDERQALMKLYDEGKPTPFIEGAKKWLTKCPVDAKVHLMLAGLLMRIGDFDNNIYHRSMFYGLMNSLVASGDGKSAKTAYKVISVDEEYTLLNYIGAELGKQSLQGTCDVMSVKIDGKAVTMYFDASIPLKAMQKAFEAPDPK